MSNSSFSSSIAGVSLSTDAATLSERLRHQRQEVFTAIRNGAGGVDASRKLSSMVDSIVSEMLHLACRSSRYEGSPESVPICVVATGGYGRGELSPFSDIDITFIPHRDGDPIVDRIIKQMFTLVMKVFIDANGLDVGYAYRLLEDCPHLDHHTLCGLLDARLLAGSRRLFIQMENDYWSYFNPADFIFTKLEERRSQRKKTNTNTRVVEPFLKEGAGGLRDLQTAAWVMQAKHALDASSVRGDRLWQALLKHARLNHEEVAILSTAKEFLFRVRNALHVAANAERDQLVVTRQEEVAELMGYGHGVEQFMRDYYVHASELARLTEEVMVRTEHSRLFLGIGLDCKRRMIEPANSALNSDDPQWMLWACELAQNHDLEFHSDLNRSIVSLLKTEPPSPTDATSAEIFTRILFSSKGCYGILQRMADLGILGWLLPEFGIVMNLIPYDPSHDYTVGQHTLYVIRNLDQLRLHETSEELREMRMLFGDLPHVEQLYLAALLHDVGKADPSRPHSVAGEEIAERVCRAIGWNEAATENVKFLVREHLVMSETSRLRDLNLDETIREFTSVVNSVDRLRMLYLLTYADTSAVGSGVWTQVKGRFLRDLYLRAERALSGEMDGGDDDAALTRTRRRLLKDLSIDNLPAEEVTQHVESMPTPYILNTSLSDMALHIGFVRRARTGEPVIDFHDERNATFTEMTLVTLDDPAPGLLAKIAGALYVSDVNVHSAQVFTRVTTDRIAIDTLYVDYRGRLLTPGKRKEISSHLNSVLTGQSTIADLMARKKRSPLADTRFHQIKVRNSTTEQYAVIELSCSNPSSALYLASDALSRLSWDILSARISLFGGKSVLSFYVVGARNKPQAEIERQLAQMLPT